MNKLEVLYEDNHLIAINKQPGDISQPDSSGQSPLQDMIKQYIKDRSQKPGNVYLGTLHRLDKPVSGVLLYAKTSKAAARLAQNIKDHAVKKYYIALTPPINNDKTGQCQLFQDYLIRDGDTTFVAAKQSKDAQKAVLRQQPLIMNNKAVLRLIDLKTGKKHQIRAQLTHRSAPVAGDTRYGSKMPWNAGSIALHAVLLRFEHPVKKEPAEILAPLPQFFIDNLKKFNINLRNEDLHDVITAALQNFHTDQE